MTTALKPQFSSLYIAVPRSHMSSVNFASPLTRSTSVTDVHACGCPPCFASVSFTNIWWCRKTRNVGFGLPAKCAGSNLTMPRTTEPSFAGVHLDFAIAPHASSGRAGAASSVGSSGGAAASVASPGSPGGPADAAPGAADDEHAARIVTKTPAESPESHGDVRCMRAATQRPCRRARPLFSLLVCRRRERVDGPGRANAVGESSARPPAGR